jgi:L-threonylcarbamoyladenylate synthase
LTAQILKPSTDAYAAAVAALTAGDVVAMPTETVYGLAADAFNEKAVLKVFAVKERPAFDPLIVHVREGLASVAALAAAGLIDTAKIPAAAAVDRLLRAFWPGPLTVALPKTAAVPDLVTSGLPRVAIRMPRHPAAQALLAAYGKPLAAPSANRFGRISPTAAEHVYRELGERIGLILDGGPCELGIESTVVGVEPDGTFTLLRPGAVAVEALEACTGSPLRRNSAAPSAAAVETLKMPLAAPGLLLSHYAPRRPLFILPTPVAQLAASAWRELARSLPALHGGVGLLATASPASTAAVFTALTGLTPRVESLLTGSPADAPGPEAALAAAPRLFAALRALDDAAELGDDGVILAEPPPSTAGLWLAIGDRLRRASRR